MSFESLDTRMLLIIAFLVYAVLILVFGLIYYGIYKKIDKEYFFFLKDIKLGKCAQNYKDIAQDLNELNLQAKFFNKYIEDNKGNSIEPDKKKGYHSTSFTYKLKDGCGIVVQYYYFDEIKRDWQIGRNNEVDYCYLVSLLDKNSNVRCFGYFQADAADNNPLDSIIYRDFDSIKKQIESLDRCKIQPNWNYIDFIYFSTITQCTVGYGDILPNHAVIRILVIFQIMLGYFILIVFINMILSTV